MSTCIFSLWIIYFTVLLTGSPDCPGDPGSPFSPFPPTNPGGPAVRGQALEWTSRTHIFTIKVSITFNIPSSPFSPAAPGNPGGPKASH